MHTVVIDLHIYLYTYIFHVGIIVVAPVEKRRNRACCNLANMPVSEEISPTTTHSQVTSPAWLHIDSVKLSQTNVGIPLQYYSTCVAKKQVTKGKPRGATNTQTSRFSQWRNPKSGSTSDWRVSSLSSWWFSCHSESFLCLQTQVHHSAVCQ
jgi:hypothetical protein